MDILQQYQKWQENHQFQEIIDRLESVPKRTPEEDSELAWAYCNVGSPWEPHLEMFEKAAVLLEAIPKRNREQDVQLARVYYNLANPCRPGYRDMLKRFIALMEPHAEFYEGDSLWNFHVGCIYSRLFQDGRALRYFEKALEACPDDWEAQHAIESCQQEISEPQFPCFRERMEWAWADFAEQEARFRQIMGEDKNNERGEELIRQCEDILKRAFDRISIEMGFNGEKYELILSPQGCKVKLFELVYFQNHAPKEVQEHWNIVVGSHPQQSFCLYTDDVGISGEDVQIWLEDQGENSFALSAYCKILPPILQEREEGGWCLLTNLTTRVLGEIAYMRYIDSIVVLDEPKEEPFILMSQLPDKLREKGVELSTDPGDYLKTYTSYQMKPCEDPDADWRLDVMVGSTCCEALINGYMNADNDVMDNLHADGVVAGFFYYPLDTLCEKEGSQKIVDFRDELEEALTAGDGPEVVTLIGEATGLKCGYVDFIAWDIDEALNRAKEFFKDSDIPWASFHTFRREANSVCLKQHYEYISDEYAEDLDEDEYAEEDETTDDRTDTFTGFVLLSKAEWDKRQFIRDLREEWGIVNEELDEAKAEEDRSSDTLVMCVGDMKLVVAFLPCHIPDNEAEINAGNNYMWPAAVEVAKTHQAHITVEVFSEESDALEKGKLFTKALATCCKQTYATGVCTSGVVFDPWFYRGFADMTRENKLPIFNWIWLGLWQNENGLNAYTCGMAMFGKSEIEVLNVNADPKDLRDFLAGLVFYVLENDAELWEEETIGSSENDRHTITRSPGIALSGEYSTLKISYEGYRGEDADSTLMDAYSCHLWTIEEKELDIDPINVYNHMAVYLRWCMEHDLMGEKFLAEFGEVVDQLKADPGNIDLRAFIDEELGGHLYSGLFNYEGRTFTHHYYLQLDAPLYPEDIDDYALKYFGSSRYHSNEFQRAAYLFLPFGEDYYQAMAKVIEERFVNWQGQSFEEDTLEPFDVDQAIMEYLDCECVNLAIRGRP